MIFALTAKEFTAARALVAACLNNMGGSRPSSLDNDPFTWIGLSDLTAIGLNRFEAAGVFGALKEKGFIGGDSNRKGEPVETYVTDAGYRWMDTVWDQA